MRFGGSALMLAAAGFAVGASASNQTARAQTRESVATQPRADATSTAPRPATTKLLTIMLDEAVLTEAMQAATQQQIARIAQEDKGFGAMVATYPGLDQALVLRTNKELTGIIHENLPDLRGLFADVIEHRMNPAQIDATANMLATPSGLAIYRAGIERGLTGKGMLDSDHIARLVRPEDVPILLQFQETGAAATFTALGAEISATSRKWGGDLIARNKDRLMTAGMAETIDFIAHAAPDGASVNRK